MNRRQALKASAAAMTGAILASAATAQVSAKSNEDQSQASLEIVMGLMGAMGRGDMEAMADLMAEDMVWLNAGDPTLPWIGPWEGKDKIFALSEGI